MDDIAMRRPWNIRVKVERAVALQRLDSLVDGVTVVIVNWNTEPITKDVVRAVQRFSPPGTRILLVDNGSTDGSRETFRHWPGVETFFLRGNAGHGVALDLAMCRVRTKVAVTLDSDAMPLSHDWLDQAVVPVSSGTAILAGLRASRNFVHPVYSAIDTEAYLRRNLSFQTHVPPGSTGTNAIWGENCWDTAELLTPRLSANEVVFIDPTPNAVPGLPGMTAGGVVYHHGGVSRETNGAVADQAVHEWRRAWTSLQRQPSQDSESTTGNAAPGISVVIPAKNAGDTIGAALDALNAAHKPDIPFEVLVADNGSSDGTADVVRSFMVSLPVRLVDASSGAGANYARRAGIEKARFDRIAVCDSDDCVDEDWLVVMNRAFDAGEELVAGVIDYGRLNTPEIIAWRGATRSEPGTALGYLPTGHGANLAFTRHLYDSIGGFDVTYEFGADDTEFCWRAQLAGFRLYEEPAAVVHYRLRGSLGQLFRQFKAYGASEAHLFARFRSYGLSRRPVTALASDLGWLATRLPFSTTTARRGAWVRRAAMQTGRFQGALKHRVIWW